MINFIIGENASGKTLKLKEILDKHGEINCATNIGENDIVVRKIDYERVESLNLKMPFETVVVGDSVSPVAIDERDTYSYSTDEDLRTLLNALCSKKDYLIYDEPESGIHSCMHGFVFTALSICSGYFKECWITTNCETATVMSGARFWVVDRDQTLREVDWEEANEILDKI